MRRVEKQPGDIVIRQGHKGTEFFVLEKGRADVSAYLHACMRVYVKMRVFGLRIGWVWGRFGRFLPVYVCTSMLARRAPPTPDQRRAPPTPNQPQTDLRQRRKGRGVRPGWLLRRAGAHLQRQARRHHHGHGALHTLGPGM